MRANTSIIGQQFGLMKVVDLDHISSGQAFWKCRCEGCGKELVLRVDRIKKGKHGFCPYFKDVKRKESKPRELTDFDDILANAITAAKELGYSNECIADLKVTKTEGEIERIMIRARHGGYKTNGKS